MAPPAADTFVAKLIVAVDALRGAHRRHAFEHASWDFVELLAQLPDYPAGAFTDSEVARIRLLAEDAVLRIEERVAGDEESTRITMQLVLAVYAIRSRLEQIEIWWRHAQAGSRKGFEAGR
jgi:hypothetical protein